MTNRKKIILIGCGNIGSRHLQAIVKLKDNTSIEIVEPNIKAQKLAKTKLNEIKFKKNNHEIIWHESLSEIKNESNLVIVATNAEGRIKLIKELLNLGHKRFIIEKIVCQSSYQYNQILILMKKFHAKGWVNTNRRYFGVYKKIKKEFSNSNFIQLSVFAGNSGLGTNAIHFLDLFSWLTKEYEIKLNGEFLEKKIITNKKGSRYKEFLGTIIGYTKSSFVSLTFFPSKKESFMVKIYGHDRFAVIDELEEKGYFFNPKGKKELKVKFGHTSELTTKIVQDILLKDDCLLPSLKESSVLHKELFRVFNKHIKNILNKDVKLCPIT